MSICRTKDKVRRTEKRMMRIYNCLICFLRRQFLNSTAKTRGIALTIRKFFENSYTVYTPENLKKKTVVVFARSLNYIK